MKSRRTSQKPSKRSTASTTSTMKRHRKDYRGFIFRDGEWWYYSPSWHGRARIANCETCDKQFKDFPSGDTKFCSEECRRINCSRCGKIFRPVNNRSTYCSLECRRGSGICENCGKSYVYSHHGAKRFCSKACFYDYTCPFGTIRPNHSGGYLIIKVGEDVPGVKIHYGPNKKGWMLHHRYVMQQKLGRPLLKTERVHHINANRKDNRPENLELWKRTHPAGVRSGYHCPGCRCFDPGFKCEEEDGQRSSPVASKDRRSCCSTPLLWRQPARMRMR